MKLNSMLFALTFFISGCANQTHIQNYEKEIIYSRINTNVIDVFNLQKMWGSSEDLQYLKKRNFAYGEFGGRLSICSTEKYHCIKGSLNVVIPKGVFSESEWTFDGINCEIQHTPAIEPNKAIICKQINHSVSFIYSIEQGIVSYVRSSQPDRRHELLGNKGLFAQPQ